MGMLANRPTEETAFSFSRQVPQPPERRRNERHLTILRVGTLICEDQRELCLIRNISAGGLMAHVYSALDAGRRVTVELKTNQQIQGLVVWTDGANAGIEFDAPIDVAELLANPPVLENGWRARMPRVEIDRLATLRAGARTYWVQARDISQGGAKVETERPLDEGAEVVLTLDGFRPVEGVVRWQNDGQCGIRFNQVIPFGELIGWLKRAA